MIAGDPNMKRAAEREALRAVIQQWNANRLDLFELSEPNEVSIPTLGFAWEITTPCYNFFCALGVHIRMKCFGDY